MNKGSKYKLNSYNDLFGVSDNEELPVNIPLTELHDFKDHPYKVIDDEDMQELVDSVREKGILVPLIARPMQNGGYEVVAGHRRKHAAELVGLEKVPVSIRSLSDSDAVDIMIFTNIQRTNILPSEKAFAYRMQWEASSHRGKKGSNTPKSIGEQAGDSIRKVQRYIRLTYLLKDLLELVDLGKLSIQAACELSYMPETEQGWVLEIYRETMKIPSGKMAAAIRKEYEDTNLTPEGMRAIILGPNQKATRAVTLNMKRINEYFPPDYDAGQIEEIVYRLLDRWRDEQKN